MTRADGWLEPSPITLLSGDEPFKDMDAIVRDFWIWSTSDLRDNTTRGVLAEFIVAKAVGATAEMRSPWDNYDVELPEGTRIEVKASAYLQRWPQRRLSTIRFSGLTGLSWNAKEGMRGEKREVRADVFVFAIQTCKKHEEYEALDISQWIFTSSPRESSRDMDRDRSEWVS